MPKIKNILIFIAIALVFFLIYLFFIKPSPEQASLVSEGGSNTLPNMDGSSSVDTNTSNTNSLVEKDFLALFSNTKNIKLDDAIFSDPAFNSLRDSSIVLTLDGTEGRPNPFAQFGNDAVVVPVDDSSPAPVTPAPAKP